MKEYIEKTAALAVFGDVHPLDYNALAYRARIAQLPTIVIRPEVRAEWKHEADADWSGGGATRCSACGFGFADGAYHEVEEFRYCPHCGAIMRQEYV